jgi:probable H4MPT-linked C1 transfer pathway protein
MANPVLGWDIGGAHLKAVLVDDAGDALAVHQVACPLWQGLDKLNMALNEVLDGLAAVPASHSVTMTGELADIFPDRYGGVLQISRLMADKFNNTVFYAGPDGFVGQRDVENHAASIASANWHASAEYVASQIESALFVDLGSTTCDLVPLHKGKVENRGYSDAERMRHRELVYTGVTRTPLMSLGDCVLFAGEWQPLAAEHFATTADVYRLTGELEPAYDLAATADGSGKTELESARRLARMLCCDLDDTPLDQWKELASGFRQLQLDKLADAVMRQYSRGLLISQAPMIGAGAGSFLVSELARQLGHAYRDARTFVSAGTPALSRDAAVCFPAYAVARLAQKGTE